jgi:hypothetical protein
MENSGFYAGIFLHIFIVWVVCLFLDEYLE